MNVAYLPHLTGAWGKVAEVDEKWYNVCIQVKDALIYIHTNMKRLTKKQRRTRLFIVFILWMSLISFIGGFLYHEAWIAQKVAQAEVVAPPEEKPHLEPSKNKLQIIEVIGDETYQEAEKRFTTMTIRQVTGYTSRVEETDASPCIAANNKNICEIAKTGVNICAANFVPLGTTLHVEKLGECIVMDRMNSRYPNSVDWYMQMDLQRALKFGRQHLEVSVVK